ncbi:MAG: hypothetical protein K0R38_6408, partial [Polyangiaceae bacterium]|nr:hypothetical protein [Polyangiaceae bacterium]
LGLALCSVREGALDDAIQRYQVLATDPRLSVLERAAAFEARGDIQTMADRTAEATAAYRQVSALDADEDRRRTMEVKTLAAGYGPRQGAALRALLIGDPKLGPSWDEAAPLLGAQAANGDPLAQYLVGRNLWLHGRAGAALDYLNAALDPTPKALRANQYSWPPPYSILREAMRVRVIVTCSDKRFERAKATDDVKRLREDPNMPAAKKEAVLRFAKRCGL